MRRARGAAVEELDGPATRELEPSLAPICPRAILFPEHGSCRNPLRLVRALAERFARGVAACHRASGERREPPNGR